MTKELELLKGLKMLKDYMSEERDFMEKEVDEIVEKCATLTVDFLYNKISEEKIVESKLKLIGLECAGKVAGAGIAVLEKQLEEIEDAIKILEEKIQTKEESKQSTENNESEEVLEEEVHGTFIGFIEALTSVIKCENAKK